jgi:hypothetical protein
MSHKLKLLLFYAALSFQLLSAADEKRIILKHILGIAGGKISPLTKLEHH